LRRKRWKKEEGGSVRIEEEEEVEG